MAGYNKTIIIGRLMEDPELLNPQETDLRRKRVSFTICNSTFDADKNEVVSKHKIVSFGKQAQLCLDYLCKGDLCCIEGRLDIKTYTLDGEERSRQFIACEKLTFLSPVHRRKESAAVSEAV